MKTKIVLIVLAILFGAARLFVPAHPADLLGVYKAFVHVFMGVLAVGAWQRKGLERGLFWGLSILEIVMAIVTRM